jgi:hypothetical protein
VIIDPQVVTVNTVAQSMPRLAMPGDSGSTFQKSDLTWTLNIRHRSVTRDKKKRVVSLVVLTQRKIVADPLTANNDYETLATSVQIDRPEVGFTSTEVDQQLTGFKTWLSSAMIGQLYGREQ